jgi:hypothetical protein
MRPPRRLRSLPSVAVIVLAATALVPAASAVEATVTPGVGIGKVRIGMTRAQVERVLGHDKQLSERAPVAGTTYLEYDWDFASWSVGFVQRGGSLRVSQVGTSLHAQRTTSGVGVGSTFKAVARAYPQAVCRNYYVSMGSRATTDPTERATSFAIVVAKNRRQLAFLVRPKENFNFYGRWLVYQVIVRNSVPGAVDFVPQTRCDPTWKLLGRPYRLRPPFPHQ